MPAASNKESSSFCCSVPLLRLLSCVAIILLRRLDGVSRWNESAYTMQPNTWHTKGPLVHPTTVSSARCLFNLDCRYPSTAQTALSNFGDDSAVYEHWMGDLTRFRHHGFALPEAVGDSRLQPTSFFLSLPLFWPPCLRRYDDRHLNSRFFKRTAYPLAPLALFQCRSK